MVVYPPRSIGEGQAESFLLPMSVPSPTGKHWSEGELLSVSTARGIEISLS